MTSRSRRLSLREALERPDRFDAFEARQQNRINEQAEECEFCGGRPVQNAARWVGGRGRSVAACPRCGVTHGGEVA